MRTVRILALAALVPLALAGCDDKKAQNNTPTTPNASGLEPKTQQATPPNQNQGAGAPTNATQTPPPKP